MALRRVPPHTYTLTPRLDVLNRKQHQELTQTGYHRDILVEMGRRKTVGGQEDMIEDVALDLQRLPHRPPR